MLKIDKPFVLQMLDSDDDAVIVRSTIDLGHNLGLEVVAEGVETADTWSQLNVLGCDIAQGYYLSRPVGRARDRRAAGNVTPRPNRTGRGLRHHAR